MCFQHTNMHARHTHTINGETKRERKKNSFNFIRLLLVMIIAMVYSIYYAILIGLTKILLFPFERFTSMHAVHLLRHRISLSASLRIKCISSCASAGCISKFHRKDCQRQSFNRRCDFDTNNIEHMFNVHLLTCIYCESQ